MSIHVPESLNVITCQVYNKDGSLDKEITTTNKYLFCGWASLLNQKDTLMPSSNDNGYFTGMFFTGVGVNVQTSSTNLIGWLAAHYSLCLVSTINTEFSDESPIMPSALGTIGTTYFETSVSKNEKVYDLVSEYDYEYNGKQYLSNRMDYDFGFGNIQKTIYSIYLRSPDYSPIIGSLKTQVLIPRRNTNSRRSEIGSDIPQII